MVHGPFARFLRSLRHALGPAAEPARTDRQLLGQFVEQADHAAFGELVQRHGPMVLAACRRVLHDGADADDAFQATFILLARKAASRGWHESIGGWLHEVAFRVASRARAAAARRRVVESQVPVMDMLKPNLSEADRQELRAILDRELAQLPEKYRAPLVLCYLEGMTNDQAAEHLGWTKGTVSGRLARARDLLRGRLARRNLALSLAVLTGALAESAAPAAVPATLMNSTIQAALLPPNAAAVLPSAVLVKGVFAEMFMTKVKTAAALLLAVALLGGVGLVGAQRFAGPVALATPIKSPDRPAEPGPKPSEPAVKEGLSVSVRATKAIFAGNEAPEFVVTFKNVSEKPFQLHGLENRLGYAWKFTGPNGGPWAPEFPQVFRSPEWKSVALKPGEETEVALSLKGVTRFSFAEKSDERRANLVHLPTGKFELVLSRIFTESVEQKQPPASWVGEMVTNPAPFEIGDYAADESKAVSKPVRVNGVDFCVVADKVWPLPLAGNGQEVEVTVRITNYTKEDLKFWDNLLPRLSSSAGKALVHRLDGRDGTRAMHSFVVAAGQSVTVPLCARPALYWEPHGKSLRLNYMDASAMYGHFEGLAPGEKYQLGIGYSTAPQAPERFWVGKVETETVEIEVPAQK
jgi:RNA polymerase sigma factor (sigma-70 family)